MAAVDSGLVLQLNKHDGRRCTCCFWCLSAPVLAPISASGIRTHQVSTPQVSMHGGRSKPARGSLATREDAVYSSQLPLSILTSYHRSGSSIFKGKHMSNRQEAGLEDVERLLREIGQELACPICLGTPQQAVMLPCTHIFCQ